MKTFFAHDLDWKSAFLQTGVDLNTVAQFAAYLDLKPHLFKEFERQALERIARGEKKLFAKKIAEDMRGKTTAEGLEFGINNKFTAYFARLFVVLHPRFKGLFEFRGSEGLHSKKSEQEVVLATRSKNVGFMRPADSGAMQQMVLVDRRPRNNLDEGGF